MLPVQNRPAISRRDFLKLSGLGFSSLALHPLRTWLPPEEPVDLVGIGRVTISQIGVFKEPSLESEQVRTRARDELIGLFKEVNSPYGPPLNPRWYRVIGGYAHSAYLQRVETASLNPKPLRNPPKSGQLGEVTVPFTDSSRLTQAGWIPLYRLYFKSVHWITGIDVGPDGERWYRLSDELLRIDYHVPAAHVRPIQAAELSPISPEVPPEKKRIEVSLADQTLTAYEDDKVVLHTLVSTGLPSLGPVSGIPTETPRGRFKVDPKVPSKHMGDGRLTDDIQAYELPGVPWVSFFAHSIGVAFHGTYWHDNFGARMSHGCVNMRPEDAKWLYRWTTPVAKPSDWTRKGAGTRVDVY
jgi:lipoprotein-anchoring transpeptidase ErfK/SrfK